MADSRLDANMEHFLEHYFLAKGNNHEIRKMFTAVDFYDFKEFTPCNKQHFVEMEQTTTIGKTIRFNSRKINLINNVSLYYHFLQSDSTTKALADDPENWVVDDFKTWRDRGRHPDVASYTASLADNATNTTTSAATSTAVVPEIKAAEDAWLSWQRSKRDADKYPIPKNDREYTD